MLIAEALWDACTVIFNTHFAVKLVKVQGVVSYFNTSSFSTVTYNVLFLCVVLCMCMKLLIKILVSRENRKSVTWRPMWGLKTSDNQQSSSQIETRTSETETLWTKRRHHEASEAKRLIHC